MIPIFLGSDIMSEYKSEDGAEHTIERRCKINVEAPYLLKKVLTVSLKVDWFHTIFHFLRSYFLLCCACVEKVNLFIRRCRLDKGLFDLFVIIESFIIVI